MASARLARRPDEQRRRSLARAVGRPPSVLLGRVPSERHEHYTPDGELTGFTVVIRDPEWTDTDVRELLELADVETRSCRSCGWHESLTGDRSNVFTPENDYCPVCAGQDRWNRMKAAEDKAWTDRHKDAPASMPQPSDGRGHTHMTLLSPEEADRRRGGASPSPHAPNASSSNTSRISPPG